MVKQGGRRAKDAVGVLKIASKRNIFKEKKRKMQANFAFISDAKMLSILDKRRCVVHADANICIFHVQNICAVISSPTPEPGMGQSHGNRTIGVRDCLATASTV